VKHEKQKTSAASAAVRKRMGVNRACPREADDRECDLLPQREHSIAIDQRHLPPLNFRRHGAVRPEKEKPRRAGKAIGGREKFFGSQRKTRLPND
jgi:hypothetical protein